MVSATERVGAKTLRLLNRTQELALVEETRRCLQREGGALSWPGKQDLLRRRTMRC